MSANKYIILGLIAVVLLAINSANGSSIKDENSHHMTVGSRMPGDRVTVTQQVVKNSSWMRIVTEEKIFNATRNEVITMVEALDQKTNGNGAYASILNGGPGHNSVTMRFKSQRSHGINFVVNVYSRP